MPDPAPPTVSGNDDAYAELHLHFEGAIRPERLLRLAKQNRVALPCETVDEARAWFRFTSFDHFLHVYTLICSCLQTADDFEVCTYELGESLARERVRYAEVTFTASAHGLRGIPFETYFDALNRGRRRVLADFGVELRWIFDIVREHGSRQLRQRWADYTVEVAIAGRDDGVVALGLGGGERAGPAREFARWFDRARSAGLRSAPHAGELVGPHGVRDALDFLGADRIAHGVRAIEDPALVVLLADRKVCLDTCPTSNVLLGVYGSYADHPLAELHRRGVPVTVSTDDPALFHTSLQQEWERVRACMGLDAGELGAVRRNAFRYAFDAPAACDAPVATSPAR